ncbi:Alpha/Beta hydrolase protein [Suillus americanus]|nr:Alpha/Beta hydrolase protein [Suillus americanus]
MPDELENAEWKYGSPLADMKRLTERWRNEYDWRKHEKEINEELPIRAKLLTPFQPGSFLEFNKILPLLTVSTPEHPSFHVVALSLPGFGFSAAPRKQGFGLNQYVEVAHKLMIALGYNEYVTQGGDWGGLMSNSRKMASVYGGRHHKAWHTNLSIAEPPSWKSPVSFLSFLLTPWSTEEKAGIERTKGQGYFGQQST